MEIWRAQRDDANWARVLSSLGTLKYDTGNYIESLALSEEALARWDFANSGNPFATVKLLGTLAAAHYKLNHTGQAMEFIERAVTIARSELPANHRVLAEILITYGAILRQAKRKPEARAAVRQAHQIVAAYTRENHLDAVVDVRSLAPPAPTAAGLAGRPPR